MTERVFNVLFLCTHNSARSIMAECILNKTGAGRFQAFSAGSHPAGQINPEVLDLLQRADFDTSRVHSKSWDVFAGNDAPRLDFVFTLCDGAAGEVCPVWPGQPMTAHWPFPDPSGANGSAAEKRAFVADVFRQINTRLGIFINLPISTLDRMSLQAEIDRLGQGTAETSADS
ncbi:arsenate reductase ArsC [Rhodovibrio salinarum]|uniref:Arsenate reductase ArsC n=1 Tax=Rhodovibrio salinarum TaxID=1087 RepID=A0A934QKD1_9PROT|nr:arsenate reductase ArsC [Rhodovibrio salinarum]MBK1698511.1 arsenate reductase ArsC [Rhodovibrio salinarum]